MNNLKISVIVPIYNVEKYLNRCIVSIVNQTYTNIEILLIDDGSTDNSGNICDSWKKKDERINVIHKNNGGLSDARNVGMDNANGQYISFIDSDDYIDEYMYEKLLNALLCSNSDISCCSVKMIWEENQKSQMLTKSEYKILNTEEGLKSIILEDYLKQPVWYKLYKASVIKNINFEKGKINEDVFWSYKVISRARRIIIIPDILYFYMQHEGSIMNNHYNLKRLDVIDAKFQRYEFMEEKYPQLLKYAYTDLFNSCVYAQQMSLKYLSKDDLNIANIKIENYISILMERHIKDKSLKEFIWYKLFTVNFIMMCKLRNLLKIGF